MPKIGRSADHVTVSTTREELIELARELKMSDPEKTFARLRAYGVVDPLHTKLTLTFSSVGRSFSNKAGTNRWILQLDVVSARGAQLEKFGTTPTTWHVNGRVVTVDIPAVRAELIKRKPALSKKAPPGRYHPGLRPPRPASPSPTPAVEFNDSELVRAQKTFNSAIERGFKPQFDGRGRIMFFERRVGSNS